jgi:hypothetical protein
VVVIAEPMPALEQAHAQAPAARLRAPERLLSSPPPGALLGRWQAHAAPAAAHEPPPTHAPWHRAGRPRGRRPSDASLRRVVAPTRHRGSVSLCRRIDDGRADGPAQVAELGQAQDRRLLVDEQVLRRLRLDGVGIILATRPARVPGRLRHRRRQLRPLVRGTRPPGPLRCPLRVLPSSRPRLAPPPHPLETRALTWRPASGWSSPKRLRFPSPSARAAERNRQRPVDRPGLLIMRAAS